MPKLDYWPCEICPDDIWFYPHAVWKQQWHVTDWALWIKATDKVTPWRSFSSCTACNHLSYLILLHSNCSEGTCDGCTFHFLWESQHACPLCTKNHYREIVSACIQGIQVMLHEYRYTDKKQFCLLNPTEPSGPSQTLDLLREFIKTWKIKKKEKTSRHSL